MRNVFLLLRKSKNVVILTETDINGILDYLEKSITNLSKEAFENLELEGGPQGVEGFIQSQFDIRLENLLKAKDSSIHHLESGMKNKIIQRKKEIIDNILGHYAG